ncbi:PKD domain-containing protein [Streptomyces chartreusis]|uniref:PKD domain-containing protein n=1 Tax=Streptomyces chartreusis TaxID=1969 RepID=UPI00364A6CAD
MLNRPAAEHAELQDLSSHLEVKAARRKWNPALHPRDSKGRFIETGGTVRLWGGKLARVVRALPNDRILVQDQTGPNEFTGRRHTTSAKWVSMVARPDGTAPTDNEQKVQEEDEKRTSDPRRGNGVVRDDDGDPDTPNDPHDVDDRGRPIGGDDDPVGPRENDDQDEPADGKLPVNVQALPNRPHGPSRFRDTAAVRQHFLNLAERPGTKPEMAQFLRSVAGDDDHLETTHDGRLIALRDDATGRWYLTATGTGQRMDAAGDFAAPNDALEFARNLNRNTGGSAMTNGGFDFSNPDLDETAGTWRSAQGENIQATIKRTRQEFDNSRTTPGAPSTNSNALKTVSRGDLKPGDRVKVTVARGDIEWPASTRDQEKPETVTVEGTIAPTYQRGTWAALLDATLTGPDGTVMASGDSARIMRMPGQIAMSGHTDGFTPEEVRADRVRVGDLVVHGEFGHVVTRVDRYVGGRTFTTRNLGGRRETDQFGTGNGDMLSIIPRARRRPEDVQRDTSRTQQHPNSADAKRAAADILKIWAAANELAEKQWQDGVAPEEFRALAQHMQNVTDAPKGAGGYHQNAEAMRGALAALEELDTDAGLDRDLVRALNRLEERLDENADRFEADSRAITENKRKREAEANPSKPEAPEASADKPTGEPPLEFDWDDSDATVTLTMPAAVAEWLLDDDTWDGKDPDTRKALEEAKRGKNGTLRVTAPIDVHHILLEQASPLSGDGSDATPTEIRGYSNYAKRIGEADDVVQKRRAEREGNAQAANDSEANETSGSGEQPPSDAAPAGEAEPYDPTFQQQADENGVLTHYRTPQGVSRDIAGRFGVGEPVTTRFGETYIVVSGNDDGTVNVRKEPLYDDAPLGRTETFQADELRTMDGFRPWRSDAAQAAADEGSTGSGDPGVALSPDEVNAPAAAARASKAPSSMEDVEIRDEIVSLMEREMANGGELEGTDRTRLRVLEAEEARRAGRKPPEEPKPKPKAPAEEPGGLFDVAPDEQRRFVADPNNPDDQADDPFGTPDMFAAAEGRDTSRLRPPQSRKPADFEVGDRFVDANGRTHTVAEEPVRTPRGRIRVVDEEGQEHLLAPDRELRVLHPDEDAPEAPETGTPDAGASGGDTPSADTPEADAPQAETAAPDADASEDEDSPEPADTPGNTADNATAPEAPLRDTSPEDMTDEEIEAELEELQAWQNRHVASSGEGPRIQGNAMVTLSPVASRRGRLYEVQRERDNARRDQEKKEKKKQERAEALARAEIGKRNDDGSYPVAVDGEDAGTVSQLARKWRYTNADGQESPDSYPSRAEAVAALVRNRDVRRENADEDARREQARSEAPEGWTLGDRDDVAENDIIRVPITRQDGNGRPYPVGWRQPVRVNSVSRNDNGTMVLSVSNLDGSRSDISPVFLSHPDDTFAWANDRTRPEPTPAWRHELRARMADIGDDIATLQNREGLQDPERIQRLQDLIQRVSRGETDDLQGDLRQIRDEAAWLEGQFDDPNLELPYETRRSRSWATAARMKAERDLRYPDFQSTDGDADGPNNAPDDDRASRAQGLFSEGMNAVGGDSLPEMQELDDRLSSADSADDRDAELRDIADRMDALAEQYELAGPQGELAADRFRRAARIARGEQEDDRSTDGESTDSQSDTTGEDVPESEEDEQQDGQDDDQGNEENRQQHRDADPDGGAADPDGGPDGGGAGTPDSPNGDDANDDEGEGDDQDAPEGEEEEERRRRRRRRDREGGNGGPGGGGPGGPGLPHLRLPDFDVPDATGDGGDGAGRSGGRDGGRSRRPRHRDVDSLRNAWRTGDGLTPAEDTPERRAHLANLADREGLALSPEGGLAMYPEPQADGTTVWRFTQARNGTNLPGITLSSDDPEEVRALAGRFEEISDRNGDPFDWHAAWGPASIAAWRDGEGRNLPQALRAVQDDYEQERAGTFTLPEDLSGLDDSQLEAAYRQGLGPEDELRVMAEMDSRDGYVDERIRAAVPETPPANAEEAEREGRLMDAALGFGDTDVTQPTPATPGRLRREFDALDEERFQAAMQATGGRMLSPKAAAQGIDPRALFSGGKFSNKRAQDLASQELKDWWEENGRLTYPQYRQREADRVLRAEFADWDEARYRQAVDFTNGYFFRREYKFGGTDFDERELFSGGSLSARDRWRQYASEELQEWFDLNGGRQTFAQFKQSRQDNDRIERQRYEEEQRSQSAGTPDAADSVPDVAEAADDKNTRPSKGGRLLVVGNQASQEGNEFNRRFRIATPGSMLPVVHDDLNGFRTQKEALEAANSLEEHVRDAEGHPFPWNAPDATERARTFRGPDGETLADSITRVLSEHANRDGNRWQFERDRAQERAAWRQQADEWHRQQEADGYTILADPNDLQPGDEVSHPTISARGMRPGPSPVSTNRAVVRDGDRYSYDASGVQALGSQQYFGYPARGTVTGPDGQSQESREARLTFGVVRRKPRPNEVTPASPVDEPQGEPEPVGGQPAHWARVEDLVPGDMVRMNGTTKGGRPVQRAGYVHTTPVLVDVTRRGRTDQMWRTWVTENPDGTGVSGNVYTSANATAARAEAPDDVVPGSPASGAQAALRSGDLPNQIPADRDGNGLFPGSTITDTGDREGTVTGATDTTVSVHWSDGNDDTALSPTTVTVTDGQRPDGWTADGHRVTTQNVVSDTDGALLGPVDDVDGDQVTITTADGTITRSAGDLRVTGEVRDDTPDTAPVTGIDEPTAADLKDGDVVVLDLDGHLATVAITSPPSRDGDRVTLQYADTTTGEIGEIDVDARAVLPRAQSPDGGAPDLGPDDAPEPDDDLTVHPTPHTVDPVTGPTVDPDLTTGDRNVIGDHADGPDDDPNAHQAAVRITADLPVTPEQAAALATQLRAAADPSTLEGRAALRAADHLDRAAGRTPPGGLDRPRPSNAAQIGEGDLVAMPDERQGDQVRTFRVIDAEGGPGGVRSFLLEDENRQWRRRVVHGAMPVWQLPEAEPEPVTPPDADDVDTPDATPDPSGDAATTPATPDSSSTPDEPTAPVARVRPGSLRDGDVIDAPVSRTGYQFNGHRRLTIIGEPQRNGWWMQLTGMDEDGNVHDFGLHNGRSVNVYDRNRPTPALPPAGTPRDPNQVPQADVDRIVSDHARTFAARIIDEAAAGTEPPGDIHALREQIAQRLTAEALRDARQAVRRDGPAGLDAAGITGRDRAAAQRRLRDARDQAHTDTVRAALRTINDLEPLDGESHEDLAARARDLLRLIPDQVAGRPSTDPDADPDVTRAVTGHADDAVNALLQQLQAAGVDPGDAERIARILTQQMAGTRQATARRIAARVAAANPDAGRQPGLIARIVALLIRMAKRLAELVKAGARKIAEKYRSSRERLRRLRTFLGRIVRRVREWPESRRLARLHSAVNLPDTDGDSLAARISHWARLMPEPDRFGQSQRRVTFWRPTTWGQLATGRLPDRSDRIQWTPDRAADGGPGLTTLRHMAALRAAGTDVDQDVTRRLSAALGDDFGDNPHATLQHADDYVASSERRLVNLQAARSGATIPDDEDLEIEITGARGELAAARREYADLRARYAAAVPDAVAAALADVRDMGPDGANAIVFGPDTDPDAERAVRGVQRLIPRAWLKAPEVRRLTAVDGTQGRYEPEGQRITVADLADEGMGTAGYALAQHFARNLGDLDAAQRAFWFSRTHTGRPGARRLRPSALDRLLQRQQTQPETGDSLARSVQAMFSGDWYQDDDLRAFLLGLMATR